MVPKKLLEGFVGTHLLDGLWNSIAMLGKVRVCRPLLLYGCPRTTSDYWSRKSLAASVDIFI